MRLFVLFLFLFPGKSFCQCPQWIGSSIENAKLLKGLVQKHFRENLKEVADTANHRLYKMIEYRDNQGLISMKIGWYAKKMQQGSGWVNLPPVVNDVSIKGPADKVDKLLADLSNQANGCPAHSSAGQSIKFSGYIMSWDKASDNGGIPMKFISIKPFSQNK